MLPAFEQVRKGDDNEAKGMGARQTGEDRVRIDRAPGNIMSSRIALIVYIPLRQYVMFVLS